jgi:hypothetical protein
VDHEHQLELQPDTDHEIHDSEILPSFLDSRIEEHCLTSQDSDGSLWTDDWGSLDRPLIDSDEELTSNGTFFSEFLRTKTCPAGSSHDEAFTDNLDWSQGSPSHSDMDQTPPLIRSSPYPDLMTCPQDEDYLVTMLPDADVLNGRKSAIEVDRWYADGVLSRASTPLLLPTGIPNNKCFYHLDSDIDIALVLDEDAVSDDVFMQEDSSEDFADDWGRDSDEELIFTFADDV